MNASLSVWLYCLKHYLKMVFFLSSPAELPHNPASLLLTLIAYIIAAVVLLGDQSSLAVIIAQVLIEVMILLGISYIILKFNQKSARLFQTMSALIGCNLIMTIFTIIFTPPLSENGELSPLFVKISLILLFWNLAVISLIFKRAFEIRTIVAGFISFNYFLFYEFLLSYLFKMNL